MNSIIRHRIDYLREIMRSQCIDAFIIPSTDPHSGEYVPQHWEARQWLSGFTGSAGTVIVTLSEAALWTDSRYFIQATTQLSGTGIMLLKDGLPGTPSKIEWLSRKLPQNSTVGIDGWVNASNSVLRLREQLKGYGINLISVPDPFEKIWTNRPSIPSNHPFILPLEYTGKTCVEKISLIREYMEKQNADFLLLSALDEIAWTINMRGNDIPCNPVFLSYLLIGKDRATIYINKVKLTELTFNYLLSNGIEVKGYDEIKTDLAHLNDNTILLPPATNFALYEAVAKNNKVVTEDSPVLYMKAIKNEVETAGFRNCMLRDGIAMVRFIIWLKEAVKSGKETETTVEHKLFELRSEQEKFKGISFDTIAGYQEHGAIVHYVATKESALTLKPEGWLLLDSGGQYLDGTTDITRTIVLGEITPCQRHDYTLVLKGMIALSRARFPIGTCGTQLDILARQYLWAESINYGHGTGHGVGHFLCVHEGPHQFRMNYMPAPLKPGMTVTNEPGIYREGLHGVRIENTMLIVDSIDRGFGKFCQFETLTLCPIDKEAIEVEMLDDVEREWLNSYHKKVYESLAPHLNEQERQWLKQATEKI